MCAAQARAVHVNSRGMASSVQSLYMAELQKVASRTDEGVRSKPKNRSRRRVFAAASPFRGDLFHLGRLARAGVRGEREAAPRYNRAGRSVAESASS